MRRSAAGNAAKSAFPRTQNRAFPMFRKALLSRSPARKRRTQLFLLSDPPHPWIYFDYDPGPLFCVHLQTVQKPFHWLTSVFIIAPQKNTVNPKPWIYRNFYRRIPAPYKPKQNALPDVAAHRRGRSVWILPWCEEESCYLGIGCGPASHGKSITAFTSDFMKKL